MMYESCEGLRRRISNAEQSFNDDLHRVERDLASRIENVHEEAVGYEQFQDEIDELRRRQNRMFRAIARVLRELNGEEAKEK